MPRDLFVNVTDPSVEFGTRKWYTVPLAFLVHTLAVGMVIVAPLMATGALPMPDEAVTYLAVVTPPLPAPPPVRVVRPDPLPQINRDAAPVEAPADIAPEPDFELNAPDLQGPLIGVGTVEGAAEAITPPPVVAPPPPEPPRVVRIGGAVRAPERVIYVAPVYPPIALTARVQGIVIIEAQIDTEGRVQGARVLRSESPVLNDAALSAVREWRYQPTLLNGIPVNVVMTVTVQFRLQ